MTARTTVKVVNDELARLGHTARLAKASGYFYFVEGEAADWIDSTVQVGKIGALTLEQWVAEFKRLKMVNADWQGRSRQQRGRLLARSAAKHSCG